MSARFGRAGRLESSGGVSAAVVAPAALLILGGFYLAFSMGAQGSKATGAALSFDEARAQYTTLKEELRICEASERRAHRGDNSEPDAYEVEKARLDKQAKELEEEEELYEKKKLECLAETEHHQQKWTEEDIKNAKAIRKLKDHQTELMTNSSHFTTASSMRTILLTAAVKGLYRENALLRHLLNMTERTDKFAHMQEIVGKWEKVPEKDALHIIGKPSIKIPQNVINFNKNLSKLIDQQRDTNITDHYDRTRESVTTEDKIFFQTRQDGMFTRPTYRGKMGTGKLVRGVHETNFVSPFDLPHLMRQLFDYSLCSMNLKKQLLFPTHFRSGTSAPKLAQLNDYLDTPIVRFCYACRPQENTPEYRVACDDVRSDKTYGSIGFWRMRSRIRFKRYLLHDAENFMSETGLDGQSLSVRLMTNPDCEARTQQERPIEQMSFRRLLLGKATLLGNSFKETCNPSAARVVEKVNEFVKENSVDRVYFSTDMSEDEFNGLATQITVQCVRRTPTNDGPADTAVDMLVASKTKYYITNRYDLGASLITEFFLLENDLRTSNIAVW